MQRLARLKKSENPVQAVELFSRYDEIRQFLLRHLPPSTATLFARPIEKGEYVEWYTDLEGQPQLPENGKIDEKTTALMQQRLSSIEGLIADSAQKNLDRSLSDMLRQLITATKHSACQLYLVNNEPVIIGWGMGEQPKPVAAPVPPVAPATRGLWRWLLPLLLLLLGLAAWWFFFRQPNTEPAKEPTPVPVVEQKPKEEPKPEPKEEPKPEPKEEPKPEPKEEPKPEPKEEPKPEVKEEPKPEVKEEPKPKEEVKPQKPKTEQKKPPKEEVKKVEKKTPPKDRTAKTEIKPGQVWSGTYMCPQGLTSIRFDIKKFDDNGAFTTVAHFKYDERRQGAVKMVGKFNNNQFFAKAVSWVKYPEVGYWILADFDGRYNPKTNRIEGRVIGDGCGGFELKKIR